MNSRIQDCLQLLNEKQFILQNALKNANEEIGLKEEELANLEKKTRLKEDEVQILQQTLRTANEKYFGVVRKNSEQGAYRSTLVRELGQVNFDLEETLRKIEKAKESRKVQDEKRQGHMRKVMALEGDPEDNPELKRLREEVGVLEEKKRRLDEKDVLAKLIASGDALETVEAQKRSIHVATGERWEVVKDMELELKELEETQKNLKERMAEEEKQQEAELEKLRLRLQEVEAKEEKLLREGVSGGTETASVVNYYFDEMDSDSDLEFALVAEPQLEEEQ